MRRLSLLVTAVVLLVASSCGRRNQWEVTVQNLTTDPASFYMTMGPEGGSRASVEHVAAGKQLRVIVGDTDTVVQSVRVVREGAETAEQTLSPGTPLARGQVYRVSLAADGQLHTTVDP